MNRVSFYGGGFLIVIGLIIWIFKQNSLSQNNIIKAFGMEFNFSTPAFIIMAFGVMLMIISPRFPDYFAPIPAAAKNYITIKDATYASRWSSRYHGYSYVINLCNNTESCSFQCNNRRANHGDPDVGAPKTCIINYFCSKDPNNIISFREDDSDSAVHTISCPKQ